MYKGGAQHLFNEAIMVKHSIYSDLAQQNDLKNFREQLAKKKFFLAEAKKSYSKAKETIEQGYQEEMNPYEQELNVLEEQWDEQLNNTPLAELKARKQQLTHSLEEISAFWEPYLAKLKSTEDEIKQLEHDIKIIIAEKHKPHHEAPNAEK